ncbi:MAG: transglutaminase domain-containing protein [Lachnospiraceae bacterium]|nr:transglutaminase domain-containing protein [Lachnospiraceae bacterium]MDD3794739.1 transglutaminase domain-containing protein [Lachnospiraceae bacterium]
MKNRIRRWSISAGILAMTFGLCGCTLVEKTAVQAGLKESPYYQNGDTWWEHGNIEEYYFNQIPSNLNEIYRELYERLKNYEDSADLYAAVGADDFWTAYYAVLADHPEFFWIGSTAQVKQSAITGTVVGYEVTTTVDAAGRDGMKSQIEAAADECISQISSDATEYQKIKYVYEYLINTTDYDSFSPDNQNIQSALLNHRSVCAGYAKAFQYILHRMGMFCTYVTGKTMDGGDHGWNIVRIGGNYYNVDVTWGDPVFINQMEAASSDSAMNYNYLCCTDAELYITHVPESSVALPECTDDSYNYYKLNNLYYETFDYDTVYNAMMNSVWSDQGYFVMKFGSADAYRSAQYELFQNDMLNDAGQYLMGVYNVGSWNYRYHTDDDFNLITIYWK